MKRIILLFLIISNFLFSQNYIGYQISQNNDLMKSIENNDIESVKNILRDGNNLDIYNNKYGMSSLMYAAKLGNMEIVKELLDFGAKDFDFAFYMACMEGYLDIAQKFINEGANNFDIALTYAAIGGHLDIVKELINLGAKDINGALVSACEGNHLEIVKYFIENGANVNTKAYIEPYRYYEGAKRKYPITAATNIDIIKELVNAGATNLNEALIYNAKQTNRTDNIFNLLELGADINSHNYGNEKTILMYLIERENPDIEAIKKIIELGADINATDRNGNNVLIRAVLFEYDKEYNGIYRVFSTPLEIMEELLKAGANMTQRNIYGNTAYRIAARNKKKDFIELFDKYRK